MREAIVAALAVLGALGASIAYEWVAIERPATRFALVDILAVADGAQQRFEQVGFDPKASEAERTEAIVAARAFGLQLDQAVARIAQQCGCVLLNRSAVVGGAGVGSLPDYTSELRAALAGRAAGVRRNRDAAN